MRSRPGSTGLFTLGGWLFADLMLAMVVLFLAMSSTGASETADDGVPSPTPLAVMAAPPGTPIPTLPAAPSATARPLTSPTVRPSPTAALPRYGITADPADARQARSARQAGAGMTLLAVPWREVEPTRRQPADFQWLALDAAFDSARQAGLEPLVIVTANPTWAWAEGENGIIHPEHLDEFAEFVEALVTRYRGYTKYWSFYNEPDCNGPVTPDIHASCWGDHGAAYARMLKTVYPAVKRADPGALVVFGGLAFDNFQPDKAHSRHFLDDVLATGGGDAFDVFNFHYYPGFRHMWENYGTDVLGKAAFLQALLDRHGVKKPFILSEIGLGSQGPGESEELQARYVAQAYARALAAGIQTIVWYDLLDAGPYGFGLLKPGFQPRPAYNAYQSVVRIVGDLPFRRALSADTLGVAGVEGYEFGDDGLGRVQVVWSVDESTRPVRLPGSQVTQVDLFGERVNVTGDGGYVLVHIGPRPSYLVWP